MPGPPRHWRSTMRFPTPFLLALLLATLSGCSSFTPAPPSDEDSKGRWVLAQEKDTTHVVTLVRGMTPAVVTKLLGKPLFVSPVKKAERPSETWTYRRNTLGGHRMSSERSKYGQVTVTQRVIYVETLELTFVDGLLATVHTSRYREDVDPRSPNHRF